MKKATANEAQIAIDEANAANEIVMTNNDRLLKLRQEAKIAALQAAGKNEEAAIQRIRNDAENAIAANARNFMQDYMENGLFALKNLPQLNEENNLIQQISDSEIMKIQQQHKPPDFLAGLRSQLDQTGMDQYERMLDDLKRNPLFPPESLKEAKKVIALLKDANRAMDLKRDAESLKDALLTPQQRLLKTLDNYQEMLARDLITSEEFDQAAAKARQAIQGDDPKLGNIVYSGSAESLAAHYDAGRPKPETQVDKQVKATKEGADAVVEKLDRVERAIERSTPTVMDMP